MVAACTFSKALSHFMNNSTSFSSMTSPFKKSPRPTDGASRILDNLSQNPELSHGESRRTPIQNKREANPQWVNKHSAAERQGR